MLALIVLYSSYKIYQIIFDAYFSIPQEKECSIEAIEELPKKPNMTSKKKQLVGVPAERALFLMRNHKFSNLIVDEHGRVRFKAMAWKDKDSQDTSLSVIPEFNMAQNVDLANEVFCDTDEIKSIEVRDIINVDPIDTLQFESSVKQEVSTKITTASTALDFAKMSDDFDMLLNANELRIEPSKNTSQIYNDNFTSDKTAESLIDEGKNKYLDDNYSAKGFEDLVFIDFDNFLAQVQNNHELIFEYFFFQFTNKQIIFIAREEKNLDRECLLIEKNCFVENVAKLFLKPEDRLRFEMFINENGTSFADASKVFKLSNKIFNQNEKIKKLALSLVGSTNDTFITGMFVEVKSLHRENQVLVNCFERYMQKYGQSSQAIIIASGNADTEQFLIRHKTRVKKQYY